MRFKPFRLKDGLEHGRLYRTSDGQEVGPLLDAEDHKYFYKQPTFSANIGTDADGEIIWAIWDRYGCAIEPKAEEFGQFVAVEARSIQDADAEINKPRISNAALDHFISEKISTVGAHHQRLALDLQDARKEIEQLKIFSASQEECMRRMESGTI